jgi:hypothetical protein
LDDTGKPRPDQLDAEDEGGQIPVLGSNLQQDKVKGLVRMRIIWLSQF